jgi:hypothetical protein
VLCVHARVFVCVDRSVCVHACVFVCVDRSVCVRVSAGGPSLQAIPQFFHSFPALSDAALSAQFDLAEDLDSRVRVKAIAAMPQLCRCVVGLCVCVPVGAHV